MTEIEGEVRLFMKEQVLIWSQLTRRFHPLCFMRRSVDYLVGETEHFEPCLCQPSCCCSFEEDFEAGLREPFLEDHPRKPN